MNRRLKNLNHHLGVAIYQKVVEDVVRILGKQGRENVLIIGEAGIGKTTLVEGLANEIIRGTEYSSLRFKRLIALDIASLTAGSSASVKKRIVIIIEEIKIAGNVIIFIDEIHNLVASESQDVSVVFTALEPHLDAGEFQFIATTTPTGFKKYIEPSSAFVRTFHTINLPPASPADSLEVVKWRAFELEKSNYVTLTFLALKSSVELAQRYIQKRVLPDSAIDLLEVAVNKAKGTDKKKITTREIQEAVTDLTKIPVRTADSKKEKELLLNLEKELHKRVVGQDEALQEVSDALRRARTGLTEAGRLIASFLFVGPTGVGKTETAKSLSAVYFGSEKAMVRLDMSEYQTPDSINRLIGPPPGREGYEEGGQLTEAVRRRPFTVILLDEIEKANKRILDVFLQLLDDARLTDGSGRTIDFSNTLVIATSNVGTRILVEEYEEDFSKLKPKVTTAINKHFRPEFLNRFTDIIVFHPLTKEQIEEITKLNLNSLTKKLEKKEIKVSINDELVKKIAKQGFSKQWGARELRRVIQEEIEEKVAKKILEGKIKPGESYTLTSEFLA